VTHIRLIGCALCYTLVVLLTKKTAASDSLLEQSLHIHLGALILLIATPHIANVVTSTDAVSSLGSLLFAELQITNLKNWPALLIIALSGVAAMFCLTHAYRTGQPARLAPFEYFMIIILLIYGNLS